MAKGKYPKDSIITNDKQYYSLPKREVQIYEPLQAVEIRLYWEDKCTKGSVGFDNVQHFAEFLRANPKLAMRIGYVTKEKS
ncbi:MAG TPA: hypothetical protein VIM65_18055 [Cyclobacteriaceae bacterium]